MPRYRIKQVKHAVAGEGQGLDSVG